MNVYKTTSLISWIKWKIKNWHKTKCYASSKRAAAAINAEKLGFFHCLTNSRALLLLILPPHTLGSFVLGYIWTIFVFVGRNRLVANLWLGKEMNIKISFKKKLITPTSILNSGVEEGATGGLRTAVAIWLATTVRMRNWTFAKGWRAARQPNGRTRFFLWQDTNKTAKLWQ